MSTTYKVTIWAIEHRKHLKRNPYRLRWKLDGVTKPFPKVFPTVGAADSFRSDLKAAVNRGEPFSLVSGLPVSMAALPDDDENTKDTTVSWISFAREYMEYKWPRVAANSRRDIANVLRDVSVVLLPNASDRPDPKDLSVVLRRSFSTREIDRTDLSVKVVLTWVERHSPSLKVIAEPDILRRVLDALTVKQNRKPAAPRYFRRRRTILRNILDYAVTREYLDSQPLDSSKLRWDAPARMKVDESVDPREVGNAHQVERLLTGVSKVGVKQGARFVAFFSTMYYALARPEEVIKLRQTDCSLPDQGWGWILLSEASPAVGTAWTDSGMVHDHRGLKHRAESSTRKVPIAPRGVWYLRQHINQFGVAPDGRLFRSVRGGLICGSTYSKVFQDGRELGLSMVEQASPLLKRPYSLRHSGISARRTAGVPARQVAEWAGNSVRVLEDVYSRVLDGYDDRWMRQMDEFYDPNRLGETGEGMVRGD